MDKFYINKDEQDSLFGDEQKCIYFIDELNDALGSCIDRNLAIVIFKTLDPRMQLTAVKRGFKNKVFIYRLHEHVRKFRVEIEELLLLHSPNIVFDICKRKSRLGWEMDVHIYGNAEVINEKTYERLDKDNNKLTLNIIYRFDVSTGEYYVRLFYEVHTSGGNSGVSSYVCHFVGCYDIEYPLYLLRGMCELDPGYHMVKSYFENDVNDFFNESMLLIGVRDTDYCHTFYQKIEFGMNKSGKTLNDIIKHFSLDKEYVYSWRDFDNLGKNSLGENIPDGLHDGLGKKVCHYLGLEPDWVLYDISIGEIEAMKKGETVIY